jgi:hypothetical protein
VAGFLFRLETNAVRAVRVTKLERHAGLVSAVLAVGGITLIVLAGHKWAGHEWFWVGFLMILPGLVILNASDEAADSQPGADDEGQP